MEDPCNSYLGAGDDPSGGMSAAFTGNTNRKRARFIVLCPPYMALRPTPQLPPDTGHGRALVDANSRWTALLHEMMHLSKISSKSRVAAYLRISYIDADYQLSTSWWRWLPQPGQLGTEPLTTLYFAPNYRKSPIVHS